ncbi:hypothetical protein [Sphingobium sp. HWE2-09]|uniref:hypothetical protein n=1 Tax=Sphingobium sp. HWE2-09 TaxID=3108390 RepID=UPI002DD00B14|nr:hypothetical protein [Sphingobium sp. HWE2-09]
MADLPRTVAAERTRLLATGRLHSLADLIRLSEGYYFVHRTPPRNERLISALRDWLMEQAQQ